MKIYPNGLESLGGDDILSQKPLWVGGNVWWVNSVTGTDAGGTAGQDREKPLATLNQALTNSLPADVILLQSGHTETLVAPLSLGIHTVIGVGTTSGKPAAQLKINAPASSLISMAGTGAQLRNIYFPTAVQSNLNPRVSVASAANCTVYGCYFECGANDQAPAIQANVASNSLRVENCTFVSTATTTVVRPAGGLFLGAAMSEIWVVGCTFDDGTVGFSGKACDLSGGTITHLAAYRNSFLRGADASIASASTGFFGTGTLSGGSSVNW